MAASLSTAAERPAAASKVNILLVDDQASRRLTYGAILEPLGENLIEAASGKEALGWNGLDRRIIGPQTLRRERLD